MNIWNNTILKIPKHLILSILSRFQCRVYYSKKFPSPLYSFYNAAVYSLYSLCSLYNAAVYSLYSLCSLYNAAVYSLYIDTVCKANELKNVIFRFLGKIQYSMKKLKCNLSKWGNFSLILFLFFILKNISYFWFSLYSIHW